MLAQLGDAAQVGAENLDADRRADAGGEHVDAGFDGHGPGVDLAGDLQRLVHFGDQFVPGDGARRRARFCAGRFCSHSGAQLEYQRGLGTLRHSFSGFNCTTVSNISIGAGSVAVSERPALPWTVSTSGNCLRMRSWICIRRVASVMDMVGSVVGM